MDNTGYVALSHQIALQKRMELVANNLANMNTTAFQGERVLFEQFLYKDVETNRRVAYVQDFGTMRSTEEGTLSPTGNQLDIAISGRGFFSVNGPGGVRYSRNGNLRIDRDARLVTRDGYPVLDANGAAITLGPRDKNVTIAPDGAVSTETGPKGRIALVNFRNEHALLKEGTGLYRPAPGQQPTAPERGTAVVQGMLEGSNVKPILEMSLMIDVQRQFEAAGRFQDTMHELRRRAVDKIGKV
ncbi:MAG: flagellar basal-body rod protein FlgF [Alphaproteobacteria bacterium]|nr:flagellar basal-body rod protein FlgF [Alphaproteobacteria bacterium]